MMSKVCEPPFACKGRHSSIVQTHKCAQHEERMHMRLLGGEGRSGSASRTFGAFSAALNCNDTIVHMHCTCAGP
jgi:hypothetical protein